MREQEFRAWMRSEGYAERTMNTCASDGRRIERDEGVDLDEEFEKDGLKRLIRLYSPTRQDEREGNVPKMKINPITNKDRPLADLLSGYKSTLSNYYRRFCEAEASGDFVYDANSNDVDTTEIETNASTIFGLERDLQDAIRENITQLDPNLEIIDGGVERKVASGYIDILAKDSEGRIVVIELKAGKASDSVIAQILGYMGDIAQEENQPVRGIIVAADFNQRLRSTLHVAPNLELKSYRYTFDFKNET